MLDKKNEIIYINTLSFGHEFLGRPAAQCKYQGVDVYVAPFCLTNGEPDCDLPSDELECFKYLANTCNHINVAEVEGSTIDYKKRIGYYGWAYRLVSVHESKEGTYAHYKNFKEEVDKESNLSYSSCK